ncbi:ZIP family metal transporter [Bacillus taeanensis]|uniref:ZIP family metal transporter n=1 Tax=Bacillus taeanensis TaxID=273032 RepID=A0A366XYG4_9BACI|nr:ZIP family metal transporter [Bacillus taeanensis]RBW69204.1 ZIP family metal transporter [Bacillus taeanensis]
MWHALLWGGIAGSAVFIGALMGLLLPIKKKIIGYIMAFGTGVLIGAASFEMLDESLQIGGLSVTISGFMIGAALFTAFDIMIAKRGGKERKRSKENPKNNSGLAIFIGTVIDAIPESVIIGISLIHQQVSYLLVIAIFISNLPEGLSSSIGLKKDGYSNRKILFLWVIVFLLSSLSACLGFIFLQDASNSLVAGISAFAAGGVVAMVSSTMMPEAHEEGGPIVGFITALGLIASLVLTTIQ